MFTVLPSLYLIGVHYFRQWRTPYYYARNDKEVFEINNNRIEVPRDVHTGCDQQSICSKYSESYDDTSELTNEHDYDSKTSKRRSHRRHRKIPITGLTEDDISYLMRKTGFDRETILMWYSDFLRDCPDGKLSKSKFIDIYQQFYKKGRVTKFCDNAFQLFDKDGSGNMEFMEFLLAISLTTSKDRLRKIELFFSMYDIDHNGLIDQNEMKSFVESIYELMGIDTSDPSRVEAKVHDLFSKALCDSLGYLGKDEFAIACENDRHIRKLLMPSAKSSNNR